VAKRIAEQRIIGILDFFAARSVDVMLVKGAALDRVVFTRPGLTMSGDVDVVVNCDQTDLSEEEGEAARALLRRGETELQGLIRVEAEWRTHHDVSMDGVLPVDFRAIWRRARPIDVLGRRALVMSPEDMLITACISSCRRRFFRLKSLCEISEITRAWDLDWTQIVDDARRWNCSAIVYAALLASKLSLGCRVPEPVFDELAVGIVRRRVIRHLVRRTSFSSLSVLRAGGGVGPSVILPYATYQWPQLLSALRAVWSRGKKEFRRSAARQTFGSS
jgi:hypothetical protein